MTDEDRASTTLIDDETDLAILRLYLQREKSLVADGGSLGNLRPSTIVHQTIYVKLLNSLPTGDILLQKDHPHLHIGIKLRHNTSSHSGWTAG